MNGTDEREARDLLLNAYLDGELDVVACKSFEERLAAEPGLAAEFAALRSLRKRLRSDLADDLPPASLRQCVELQFAVPRASSFRSWRAIAASLIVGLVIGGSVTFGVLRSDRAAGTVDQIVAGHIRALMASQPIDVASSDRHTVKPWFDGKLAFAPEVMDLAASGFPLLGGRIDVVDLEPAPALVYRAGKHLISLVETPGRNVSAAPVVSSITRGFEAISWSDSKATYWAVSDASDEALQAFVKAMRVAGG